MNDYDYIIAGGGMAGLSLAWHITQDQNSTKRILIIDKEAKTKNDRTWCFWHRGDFWFSDLAHRQWSQLFFNGPGHTVTLPLGEWTYSMLRGIDFYTKVQADLAATGRVDMLYGTIEGFSDHEEYAAVQVHGRIYQASWVFDGAFIQDSFVVPPNKHDLKQHFRGWFIETTKPVFNPEVFTMFDLNIPQNDAFRFMYILPESTNQALVEYTLFSHTLLTEKEYEDGIHDWISNKLGLSDDEWKIIETEKGIIPMTDMDLPRKLGRRIMAIGSKGGRVKASTGFAFYRTQKDSHAIAQSLAIHGTPFAIPKDPTRYKTFDTMLLQILYRAPNTGAKLFSILFKKNPINRLFRFLNEEGHIGENLLLMSSVPWWPFIKAWFKCKVFGKV